MGCQKFGLDRVCLDNLICYVSMVFCSVQEPIQFPTNIVAQKADFDIVFVFTFLGNICHTTCQIKPFFLGPGLKYGPFGWLAFLLLVN